MSQRADPFSIDWVPFDTFAGMVHVAPPLRWGPPSLSNLCLFRLEALWLYSAAVFQFRQSLSSLWSHGVELATLMLMFDVFLVLCLVISFTVNVNVDETRFACTFRRYFQAEQFQ